MHVDRAFLLDLGNGTKRRALLIGHSHIPHGLGGHHGSLGHIIVGNVAAPYRSVVNGSAVQDVQEAVQRDPEIQERILAFHVDLREAGDERHFRLAKILHLVLDICGHGQLRLALRELHSVVRSPGHALGGVFDLKRLLGAFHFPEIPGDGSLNLVLAGGGNSLQIGARDPDDAAHRELHHHSVKNGIRQHNAVPNSRACFRQLLYHAFHLVKSL